MNAHSSTSSKDKNIFAVTLKEINRIYQRSVDLVDQEICNDPENTILRSTSEGLKRIGKKLHEQCFQVAVLALVKSGKSTLINALLGNHYLPSSNTPETARIVRIRHISTLGEPFLEEADRKVATGVEDIHDQLKSLNKYSRKTGTAPAEDELILSAPLACLATRPLGNQKFEVLDTPGPNEAGTDFLRARVDRLLDEVDVIIYLLDYTKLKTEEEKGLFSRLASMRPELLKRFSERLFFVVNKIDLENSRGLSPEETQQYVTNLLSEQVPGLNISSERVFLVSAERGLLARLVKSGHADDGMVRDFAKHVFGLSGKDKTIEDCQRHAEVLLEESKIVTLEENIISFIYKNSARLFFQSIVDDLERLLLPFGNHLTTALRAHKMDINKLREKANKLEQELATATKGFDKIDSLASSTAKEVEEWMYEQFSQFQDFVKQELLSASGQRQVSKRSLISKITSIFRSLDDEIKDKAAADQRLREANQTIAMYLNTKFSNFRGELEQEALDRQKTLFGKLESELSPLAEHIEGTVNKQLNISLRPVSIQIPAPSLDELHDQIQERINKLVQRHTRSEKYQGRKRYLKKKGGWCSDDEYGYQPIEKTREITRYSINSKEVLKFWSDNIKGMTEMSVTTVRRIIKDEIGVATDKARLEIKNYRDGYVQTVNRSLEVAQKGSKERNDSFKVVKATHNSLVKLQGELKKCHQYLEAPA